MDIVAVSGSYRAGGVTDRTLAAVVAGARDAGADVGELFLRDVEFEYCRNCRACWDPATEGPLGECPISDRLTPWLERIAAADGLIVGSPVNLGVLTAVFKKFGERCAAMLVQTPMPRVFRWLTGMPVFPAARVKRRDRQMVWVTASGAPAFLGKRLMKGPKAQFKGLRECWPGKLVDFIWVGGVKGGDWDVPEEVLQRGRRAGAKMAQPASG
jgi:NAD(P)H-dependent FMN reductase